MPYSYPTTPGVTYAVECAAEVFVTNPQTGAVAVSGDGSATVYFTATDTLYDISDDSAKVQPLFKLAPRLRRALLQGVAGGLLPKGYTELEYLESSGTQYINTQHIPDTNTGLYSRYAYTTNSAGQSFGVKQSNSQLLINARYALGASNGFGWNAWAAANSNKYINPGDIIECSVNWMNNRRATVIAPNRTDTWSVTQFGTSSTLQGVYTQPVYLFGLNNNGSMAESSPYRMFEARISRGAEIAANLIPALRKADGVAGMWDTVSKQFFANAGKGTFGYRIKRTGEVVSPMSLRDPWRVAPSGVYARKAGENELEIVADTEDVTGDGWEWYATVADAYDGLGVAMPAEF